MPIRMEEIIVTEEDTRAASNGRESGQKTQASLRAANLQRIKAFIKIANPDEVAQIRQAIDLRSPPGRANFIDRALLSLYLNLTPFILSLVFIVPLVLWLGWFYLEIRPFIAGYDAPACPPSCTWWDIAYWAAVGGVSLITAVLVSYALRGRLIGATKKG